MWNYCKVPYSGHFHLLLVYGVFLFCNENNKLMLAFKELLNLLVHIVWSPHEGSSETNYSWWLTFGQPERESKSSESVCYKSSTMNVISQFSHEDDFRSGCQNFSHQQHFFSELPSPRRSHYTNYWHSRDQTIYTLSLIRSLLTWYTDYCI